MNKPDPFSETEITALRVRCQVVLNAQYNLMRQNMNPNQRIQSNTNSVGSDRTPPSELQREIADLFAEISRLEGHVGELITRMRPVLLFDGDQERSGGGPVPSASPPGSELGMMIRESKDRLSGALAQVRGLIDRLAV